MNSRWHNDAVAELEEAAVYYGLIDLDLGERFVHEIEIAIADAKASPAQRRKFDAEARRVRVKGFPYAIIYRIDSDALFIVSVMHLHREPGYWKSRI
jgi:plasmid stabilization system protein ParE